MGSFSAVQHCGCTAAWAHAGCTGIAPFLLEHTFIDLQAISMFCFSSLFRLKNPINLLQTILSNPSLHSHQAADTEWTHPVWQSPPAKTSPMVSCRTKSLHVFCRAQSSLFSPVSTALPFFLLKCYQGSCFRSYICAADYSQLSMMLPTWPSWTHLCRSRLHFTSVVLKSWPHIHLLNFPPPCPSQTPYLLLPGQSRAPN